MAEQYSFQTNPALITNPSIDGNIIWTEEECSSINYSDNENITLTDTITDENYETAEEDNNTQYLSVLDNTHDISINDINVETTEETDEAFVSDDLITTGNVNVDDQLMVYTVEGSDELIGVQLQCDEDGNLQKCEYKFKPNQDGQLEAVSKTFQLISNADEINLHNINNISVEHFSDIGSNEINNDENTIGLYKQEDSSDEHILSDNLEEIKNISDNEHVEDVKAGILEDHALQLESVKEEILPDASGDYETIMEDEAEVVTEEEEEEHIEYEDNNYETVSEVINQSDVIEDLVEENTTYSEENNYENDNEMIQFETVGNCNPVYINEDEILSNKDNEQLQLNDFNDNNQGFLENLIQQNGTEIEDYHIVENLNLTGDVENGSLFNELPFLEKTGINNRFTKFTKSFNKKPIINNKMFLYVVENSEKENLNSLDIKHSINQPYNKTPKINPRSILKSSHSIVQDHDLYLNDELMGKRFARGKEAVQARMFHNFINKTTIPQAPIRKDRLPRKQKISLVERMDEEIVVQEVMISPKGFVETENNIIKDLDKLVVTKTVILSDSDDDYDPKKANRRKRKHKKLKSKIEKITISDSEEGESDNVDIIQIVISDVENDDKVDEVSESSLKKIQIEIVEEEEEEEEKKSEIPCPKCSKSFPSHNSLRTHLQHHNLETSLLRKARGTLSKLNLKNDENPKDKYKCNNCGNIFKNNILLTRHKCIKDNKFNCIICKKSFVNVIDLNKHKKMHAKQYLCKSTVTETVSPKKIKSPKVNRIYKCKNCSKVCVSITSLNVHIKSHKKFTCTNCLSDFVSKFMLDRHMREKCVKSPNNKMSKPLTRRSMMKTPILKKTPLTDVSLKRTDSSLSCDKCKVDFRTRSAKVQHNELKHKTPEKRILNSKITRSSTKAKKFLGGIPLSKQMNLNFALLKAKLDFVNKN